MDELIQAIAVTAEISGTRLSEAAAMVMAQDLSEYPLPQVIGALKRCRLDLKGRLTVAEILSRLDDGRPGPEEAWSSLPFNEDTTVVWTEEMAQAWGVAAKLIEHDKVGARMAFKEAYGRIVTDARASHVPVKWTVSFGHDPHGRDGPLLEAAEKRRLPAEHVKRLLQPAPASTTFERLTALAYANAEVPRLKGLTMPYVALFNGRCNQLETDCAEASGLMETSEVDRGRGPGKVKASDEVIAARKAHARIRHTEWQRVYRAKKREQS